MAKQASNTVVPAAGVTLSPLDAARLAAKSLLPSARIVEGVNIAGEKTSVDINDPAIWQQWGSSDAVMERGSVAQLALYRALLKDAPFAVWTAFSPCYIAGAEASGWKDGANLLHRRVYKPLAEEGIVKPVSPTSSNARVVSDVKKAETERKAAAAKALTELKDADIAKELSSIKDDPERKAALHGEMARRTIAETKANAAKVKEQAAAGKKSLTDAIALMSPAQMVTLLGFAMAIIAVKDNSTALYQHCAKVLDQYDNADKPAKKGAKKTKH